MGLQLTKTFFYCGVLGSNSLLPIPQLRLSTHSFSHLLKLDLCESERDNFSARNTRNLRFYAEGF
jgi:hypothetical protein